MQSVQGWGGIIGPLTFSGWRLGPPEIGELVQTIVDLHRVIAIVCAVDDGLELARMTGTPFLSYTHVV